MSNMEHAEEFAGKQVVSWEPGEALDRPAERAYRIAVAPGSGQNLSVQLADFLAQPGAVTVTALVVGRLSDDDLADFWRVVEALVVAREKLPGLMALFLGDVAEDKSEIFWIDPGDVSPLLGAYPALEAFRVRGGPGLTGMEARKPPASVGG
jgi:hypothetical protein